MCILTRVMSCGDGLLKPLQPYLHLALGSQRTRKLFAGSGSLDPSGFRFETAGSHEGGHGSPSLNSIDRPSTSREPWPLNGHKCWEIAKYPTKSLQVTQGLVPGIGGGAIR